MAGADSLFYIWTLASVNELIITLRARKQHTKANLYSKFQKVLYISCFLCVSWAIYTSAFILNDTSDKHWDERWAVDAVYEFIYVIIFITMAYLWAPSKNSQRYAFSIELSSMKDDGTI